MQVQINLTEKKPFRPFTVFNASLSFVVFLHSALTLTDKFSGIFKAELPALIERRFCKAGYFLAAVFTVCVMKIKRENVVFYELLLFRIFTLFLNAAFSNFKFSPSSTVFLPVFLPFLTFFRRFFFLPVNSCTPSLLFPSFPTSLPPRSSNPHYYYYSPIHVNVNRSFLNLSKQEVLPDRKRVTTRSYLPISPVDTDSGRNFTCVASNPAVPMGKRATVTLNIHRTSSFTPSLLFFFFCV